MAQSDHKVTADAWTTALERLAPEGAKMVVAYVTGSARTRWKLYTTPELTDYIEVADDDIVYSIKLTGDHYPLGGSIVWIRPDASVSVRHRRTTSRHVQAEMLSGHEFPRQTGSAPTRSATEAGRGVSLWRLTNTVSPCGPCPFAYPLNPCYEGDE